jgi:hypothetical protein
MGADVVAVAAAMDDIEADGPAAEDEGCWGDTVLTI